MNESILQILSLLTPLKAVGKNKVRIGTRLDGGYVMLDTFQEQFCAISIGIGGDVSWDMDLALRGGRIFQFDHTVETPPESHNAFSFSRLGLAPQDDPERNMLSLKSIIARHDIEQFSQCYLKIDIEDAEWDILDEIDIADLQIFDQICLEFHGMERLQHAEFREKAGRVFAKLAFSFAPIHVHGNNWGSYPIVAGIPVPSVLEITYAKRAAYEFEDDDSLYPTRHDFPNKSGEEDYFLGSFKFIPRQNISRLNKPKETIPKKLHFITGLSPDFGGKPFAFIHYMAVRSALALNPGFQAFVHYQHEPSGPYWDLIKAEVTHVPVVAPDEVFGNRLEHFAHKADVLRLQILLREGGVYLDFDTICQKPFEPLFGDKVVMGIESTSLGMQQWHDGANVGLCNALVIAPPDAPFLKIWYETYRDFNGNQWNQHSVIMPALLARRHPDLIDVKPPETFFWPVCTPEGIRSLFLEDDAFPDAVSFHLWETLSWSHSGSLSITEILNSDTTYNRIARKFLFTDQQKLFEIPTQERLEIDHCTETEFQHKFSLVACARWETPFIVEWLNYYRAIGFDHVFLYCNDDDPTELYERTLPFTQGKHPFVSFRFYPEQGKQLEMYAHFLENDRTATEWVGFLDIDEFIRLPKGQSIREFMHPFEEVADCVLFNWIFFGPNGHKTPPNGNVTTSLTRREANIHPFTKYLMRSSFLVGEKLADPNLGHGFWHFAGKKTSSDFRSVNVLGEDMKAYYDGFPSQSANFVNDESRKKKILSTAIIHHYAFRSEEAFFNRTRRGLNGAFGGQVTWANLARGEHFEDFLASINQVEDKSLAVFWLDFLKLAANTNVLAPSDRSLVSYRKKAFQSSISKWSVGATASEDASGAVNGIIDGTHKFHTDIEDAPWWMVDLGRNFGISRVQIYNRIDQEGVAQRASRLKIEVGLDAEHLAEFFRKDDDEVFGGADGNPLVWKPVIPVVGRFVRITLLRRDYLHLDQVEVYGDELNPALEGLAAE